MAASTLIVPILLGADAEVAPGASGVELWAWASAAPGKTSAAAIRRCAILLFMMMLLLLRIVRELRFLYSMPGRAPRRTTLTPGKAYQEAQLPCANKTMERPLRVFQMQILHIIGIAFPHVKPAFLRKNCFPPGLSRLKSGGHGEAESLARLP